MTTTEDEAKAKWCPFARGSELERHDDRQAHGRHDVPTNHVVVRPLSRLPISVPEPLRCIASQCMAWRWYPAPRQDTVTIVLHVDGSATSDQMPATHGGCGLAGKP